MSSHLSIRMSHASIHDMSLFLIPLLMQDLGPCCLAELFDHEVLNVLQANVEFFKFVCPVRASDSIAVWNRTSQVATVYLHWNLHTICAFPWSLFFSLFLARMGEMPGL